MGTGVGSSVVAVAKALRQTLAVGSIAVVSVQEAPLAETKLSPALAEALSE